MPRRTERLDAFEHRAATGTDVAYPYEVATSLADLERHRDAWEDLLTRSLEDNFYFSPDVIGATLRHLERPPRWWIVFVYSEAGPERRLVGCAPFSLAPQRSRTGAHVLSTFSSPHSPLSHPLLDRDCARSALSSVWDWVDGLDQPWDLVRLRHMSASSPTWALIHEELGRRGRRHWTRSHFARPTLRRHESFEHYLSLLSSSRRKNLRRRRQRLERFGEVSVGVHRSMHAPDLARRFMELEARSWKGDEGTALLSTPRDAAFFTEITGAAAARSRLFFVEVKVGDRTIAMTANFKTGRTMFAFKVAYDPEFHECSPGILAELESVRAFHDDAGLELADSGTAGRSHLDEYWPESQMMQEVYTSTGHFRSELHLRATVALTRVKRALSTRFAAVIGKSRGPQPP